MRWRLVRETSEIGLEPTFDRINRELGGSVKPHTLAQWKWQYQVGRTSGKSFELMVLERGDDIIGCAPFLRHAVRLDFSIGEASLFTVAAERLAIEGGPVLPNGLGIDVASGLVDLFRAVRESLTDTVVFLSGVDLNGPLIDVLSRSSELRECFFVLPHGPAYVRRFARLEGGYRRYLSTLGKGTRKDLRRTRRRFEERTKDFEVRIYRDRADVDRLLRDAGEVSRKTYQWHLLGLAVRPGGPVENRVRVAAEDGSLLSFVLFVDSRPVAFQIGYRFGEMYSAQETGFDPASRKMQPGIFLVDWILEYVSEHEHMALFDFEVGDSLDKSRLSNESRAERHFYLFPKTRRGTALAYAKRSVDGASALLGTVTERLGVKAIIKRFLRRTSVAQGN